MSRAGSESLLKWVNTFDGVYCESFQDLSSGQTLLECIRKIMPDVLVTDVPTKEPWKELFSIFEEFYGFSLQKAVSAKEISSGNQEHIARMVVLLLSVAVQSKSNDKIIADITSMDYEVQRDLMFFIETTLAKVRSHAIVAGTFTSGVGESLPTLDSSSLSQQTTPDSTKLVPEADQDDVFTFVTPRRPSRGIHPANFYNGLDSAAGAKLLMSPAIVGRARRQGCGSLSYDDTSPVKEMEPHDAYAEREDISRMKHSVRVLQGTLQVEKKLAQEYYTELCTKIQECENMKKDHYQLERKLDGLQEISDIQDELSHATSNLALAEKTIASYKSKVETLEVYKKKNVELEDKISDFESRAALRNEQHVGMSKLENVLLEKSGSVKRLELQLSKTTIELETKSVHMESLLQENRKDKIEMGEMRNKYRQLESHVMELKAEITNKDDTEVATMEKKREMTLEIQKLQDTLLTTKEEVLDWQARMIVTDTSMAATESQMKELHDELSSKISQLTSKDFEVQSLKSTLSVQDERIFQLRTKLKTLEHVTVDNEAMLQQDITDVKSALASKECQIKSLEISKKELEGETSRLRSIIAALKKEDKSAMSLLECQRDKLRSELTSKTSELASKSQELESLRSTKEGLDDHVTQLQSSMHTLEKTIAHKEGRLQRELSDKISVFASKESHIRSLEITNTEQETEVAKLKSTIDELRQENESALADFECQINELHSEVSSKASALASKNFELETLRSSVEGLDDQTARLQSDMKTLEGSAASKEAKQQQELAEKSTELVARNGQIMLLEHSNRELKDENAQLQDAIDSLNQDVLSKDAEKVSREIKMHSLVVSKTDLEKKLSQLQFDILTLEEKGRDRRSSRDQLEDAKVALETQATELKIQIKTQGQDIATKDIHLAVKNRQLDSLDTIKEELESEFRQLQLCYQRLERSATIKEAELEARKKEQEVEAVQRESTIDALRYAITTLEADVSSKQRNITALGLAEKEQQEKLLQLEASSKLLQQDLASKYSDQLADSNAKVSSLQDQLSENVGALGAELTAVRAKMKSIEAEVLDKDQTLATLKENCTSKSDQLADSHAKVSSLVEMRDRLSEHVGALEAELTIMQTKVECVEAEVSDKDQVLTTLRREYTSKSDQLADSNAKISSLVEMRDRLSEHVGALEAELSIMRTTIEGVEAEVSDKDQVLITLRQECTSKSDQLADSNSKLSSLQDQLSEKVGALETELAIMRTKMESVEADVSDKDQMLATLRQECTSKSNQLTDNHAKVSSLIEVQDQLTKHVNTLVAELTTLRAKIEGFEEEVADKDQMLTTLKQECSTKSDQLAYSNATVSSLAEMRDRLSEHVGALEVELTTAQAKIERIEAEVSDKDQVLATLKEECTSKSDQLADSNSKLSSLVKVQDQLSEHVGALEVELTTAQAKIERIEAEVSDKDQVLATLKEECTSKSDQLTDNNVQISSLIEMRDKLSEHVGALEAELSIMQTKTEAEVSDKDQVLTTLKLECTSKSDQLADNNTTISSLVEMRDRLSKHVGALEAELAAVRAKIKSAKAEMSDKDQMLATLKEECVSKSDQLVDNNVKLSSLVKVKDQLSEHVGALEAEVTTVQAEIKSVKAEMSDKDQMLATLTEECTSNSDELADNNVRISSLVEMRDRLSEHVGALEAELTTARAKIEAEVSEKDQMLATLKQECTLKLTTALAKIENVEAEMSDKDKILATLKHESTSKSNQLADKKVEISSLIKVQNQLSKHVGALEAELTGVRAKIKAKVSDKDHMLATLRQECTSKSDQLADNNVRISSLVEHVGVLEAELTTARTKIESVEAEVADKDQMLVTLKEECTSLRTKASHLTQLVASLQSSLKASEDLSSTLTNQKKDVKARCEKLEEKLKSAQDLAPLLTSQTTDIQARYQQLEEQLKDAIQTNSEREAAIAMCKSKLESYELTSQRRLSIQSEREEHIETLSKDNKWLQSNVGSLMKELHVMADTAQKSGSRCEQLETDLVREQSVSHRLKSELGSLTAESSERQVQGPMSPFGESSTSIKVPSDRYGSSSVSISQTTDICTKQSEFSEPPFDDKDRMTELKRRNKRALPHLKSSYPIEMQTKPETTPTSDDRLKHGRKSSKATQCASAIYSRPDRGTDASSPKSNSSRRSSAPLSPMSPEDYRRKQRTMQRTSMCPTLNLREYPEESVSGSSSEKSASGSEKSSSKAQNSTTFDIAFSPPKGKAPKRLRENKLRRRVESNESDDTRRETITRGNSNKSVPGPKGTKRVLRSRNDNS